MPEAAPALEAVAGDTHFETQPTKAAHDGNMPEAAGDTHLEPAECQPQPQAV